MLLSHTPRPSRLSKLSLQQLDRQLRSSSINPSSQPPQPHTHTYATMTDNTKWKFNHTMLRVKDPQKSLEYYKLLGLSQINKIEMPENKFDLYFLGTPPSAQWHA